jgi:hypothetical protein
MTRYYKVDSRKITFVEYWRLSSTFSGFLGGCVNKMLGRRMKLSEGIPEPTTFRDRIAQKEELLPHLVANLENGVADCVTLGFGSICYFNVKNKLNPGESGGVHLLHESGEVAVTIVHVKLRARERTVIGFISLLSDGKTIATSNKRPEFNNPPGVEIERLVGGGVAALWQRHSQRLERVRDATPPRKLIFPAAYEELFEAMTKKVFEHNVRRGLWVEMTALEIVFAKLKLPPAIPRQ